MDLDWQGRSVQQVYHCLVLVLLGHWAWSQALQDSQELRLREFPRLQQVERAVLLEQQAVLQREPRWLEPLPVSLLCTT